MKSIVLAFDDAEFESLKEAKGSLTWREFVLLKSHPSDCGVCEREKRERT